ncbi:PepSY domain-containing protein [Pinibacter aurantiacus]|uniref:PepSY domain-containing protein n=1 Tax=Pinibacter aurantiacus TaxID=2851599 RepID=A0A9E2S675_9BACT|nr:PepSY domain-containing protein [Pinibacter aurantiacus]MBV4356382.1 PepSY domain-containing protein [Pinibacter aurantiacus]
MSLRKYVRQRMMKWHRTVSLITGIPVLLWAASGFLHPLMTNVRPKVAQQTINASSVDTNQIVVPLSQALLANKIDSVKNVRFVHINKHLFYQIELPQQKGAQYISTESGKSLANGDEIYAKQLASIFLSGNAKSDASVMECCSNPVNRNTLLASTNVDRTKSSDAKDCCENINMKGGATANISGIQKLTSFNEEYKYINRLLPVYKVNFKRDDNIRIYVETTQDRFAFAMDKKRLVFDKIFSLLHNWSWLDGLGKGRLLVISLITALAFFNTILGLYVFFTTKAKKNGNGTSGARNNHRFVSIVAALFTLLFTFSGWYHAFNKMTTTAVAQTANDASFAASELKLDLNAALQKLSSGETFTNIGLADIDGTIYWQLYAARDKKNNLQGDLMKDQKVAAPLVKFVSNNNYELAKDGEKLYAQHLANMYSESSSKIVATELVTKFTDEYGFINKRLPVWKVQYETGNHEKYYVETSTGALALKISDKDLAEGYSFALLHKHHFMDFGGKMVRDISTMFWAFMQIAMVVVGFVLYFKLRGKAHG